MDPSGNSSGPATLKIRLSTAQVHGVGGAGAVAASTTAVGPSDPGLGGGVQEGNPTRPSTINGNSAGPSATTIRLTVPSTAPVFPYTHEEQFIIRMPPSVANQVREELREGEQPEDLSITFSDARRATVLFHGRRYVGVLLDLPTILETHKTRDRTQYYKIADISQILMILPEGTAETNERLTRWEAAGWQMADGITPPMRAVRKRRFRRTTGEVAGRERDVEALEKRVQALLDRDSQAVASSFTVYDGAGRAIFTGGGGDGKFVRLPVGGLVEEPAEEQAEEQLEELEHESDEEFAAELEEEMLLEEQATEAGDETSQPPSVHSPSAALSMPSPTPSPAVLELQAKINERKAQLASVSNPLIKARLEDVIRQLEQDLQARNK